MEVLESASRPTKILVEVMFGVKKWLKAGEAVERGCSQLGRNIWTESTDQHTHMLSLSIPVCTSTICSVALVTFYNTFYLLYTLFSPISILLQILLNGWVFNLSNFIKWVMVLWKTVINSHISIISSLFPTPSRLPVIIFRQQLCYWKYYIE